MKSLICLVAAALLFCSTAPAGAGVLDMFSGLTGRTSNDAHVTSDNYIPKVSKDLASLKGKAVSLANFSNQAENTHQFSYPSRDGKFFYVVGHGSIEAYFWYCFKKALTQAGIIVQEGSSSTPGVSSLTLKLKNLTDSHFLGTVVVTNSNDFFKKDITADYSVPQTEDRDELAFHSYHFMDKIIKAIFTDPQVLKACGWSR